MSGTDEVLRQNSGLLHHRPWKGLISRQGRVMPPHGPVAIATPGPRGKDQKNPNDKLDTVERFHGNHPVG